MLYPTDAVKLALAKDETLHGRTWEALKSIGTDELLGEGRVYGGGLHKLEPRELANVRLEELNELFPEATQSPIQGDLFA